MRAPSRSLEHAWTWASIFLIHALREAYERCILPFIKSLHVRAPKARAMRRFIEELLNGEAQLEKLIRNAAARELGLPHDRRSWRVFMRPKPRNGIYTLLKRARSYRKLLRDVEQAISRRIERIERVLATTPLAGLRADAAALALRASTDPVFQLSEPAASSADFAPLAARPP